MNYLLLLSNSLKNPKWRFLSTVLLLHQSTTMAGSSSVHDQTAHSSLLSIKQNQNLILDLSPFKYDSNMLPITEFLKYSPLLTALTKVECVLMSLLLKAYSSVSYIKEEKCITFWHLWQEIIDHQVTVLLSARACLWWLHGESKLDLFCSYFRDVLCDWR